MIEADVSLAETTRYPVPIMAHPPHNISDITLEDWLIEVVRSNSGKGIKLDFKSTRVVEPAFRVLARHSDYIKGPVVLNADILPGNGHPVISEQQCLTGRPTGPNKPSAAPVDAWTFLMLCRTRFPKAIISIGWTTNVDPSLKMGYTRDMVDHMASLVKEYNLMQPVTFAVNATLLKYSICELQRLLFQVGVWPLPCQCFALSHLAFGHMSDDWLKLNIDDHFDDIQVPNSTLTVWAHTHEFESGLNLHDLVLIRKSFSMGSVFYDMPSEVLNQLRVEAYTNHWRTKPQNRCSMFDVWCLLHITLASDFLLSNWALINWKL